MGGRQKLVRLGCIRKNDAETRAHHDRCLGNDPRIFGWKTPPTPRPPRNDDGVQHVVQTQAYFSYKLLQQQEKIKK